jgi:hypothetical protein
VRLLIERGADVNARNTDGRLPLHDCFELDAITSFRSCSTPERNPMSVLPLHMAYRIVCGKFCRRSEPGQRPRYGRVAARLVCLWPADGVRADSLFRHFDCWAA